jgi:hypothetical protein
MDQNGNHPIREAKYRRAWFGACFPSTIKERRRQTLEQWIPYAMEPWLTVLTDWLQTQP